MAGNACDGFGAAGGLTIVPLSMFKVSVYCELRGRRFLSVSVTLIEYMVFVAEVLVGLKVKQRTDLLVKVVVSLISTATTMGSLSGSE